MRWQAHHLGVAQLRRCAPPPNVRETEPTGAYSGGGAGSWIAAASASATSSREDLTFGDGGDGGGGGAFGLRSLLPIDSDVIVLSICTLLLNLLFLSSVLSKFAGRPVHLAAQRHLHRFVHAFDLLEVGIAGVDDFLHYALQLTCAAYAGRVSLAHLGLLAHHEHPLDFGSGGGLALHVALGFFTWSAWCGIIEATVAIQEDYAKWRWSTQAITALPAPRR